MKYLVFLLMPLLLLLSACREETFETGETGETGTPEETGWTKVHLRATVSQGAEAKATLDQYDLHYIFERDDLLYVVDTESYGVSSSSATYNANSPKLYGFLYLISGAGTTSAVFEGDLMYFDPTSHEPVKPGSGLSITATLVSDSQRAGSSPVFNCAEGKITYAVSGGTIDVGPSYGNHTTASFKESVQKYSHFTAEATYGNPSFSLRQQSSFLFFNFSFDDDVNDGTSMTVKMFNNTSEEQFSTSAETASHQIRFVGAFKGGTVLSNAKVSVEDGASFSKERSINGATLQANCYYNVTKTFIPMNYLTVQATQTDPSVTTTVTFNSTYTSGLEYRTKSGTVLGSWTPMPSTITLNGSDAIQIRGTNSSYDSATLFSSPDKPCHIYGDIMSLFCTSTSGNSDVRSTSLSSGALQGTFQGLTNIDIPSGRPLFLYAASLSDGCYKQMFAGCTSLTRMPSFYSEDGLHHTSTFPESACEEMFSGCTALAESSNLPATTVGISGYKKMFYGCTALVTAPDIQASTLGNNASQEMFSGCTSLLLCPALTAASVPQNGYRQMFEGCTALVDAPDIDATAVNAYSCYQMFKGCTSLETPPAELSAAATADHCYASMFEGCTQLGATPLISASGTLATSCFESMFSGCGMLRRATNSAFSFSVVGQSSCYRMFYNCGLLNNAPNMPNVTSVGMYGCKEMYASCSELSVVPTQLTAAGATVGEQGFYQMFYQCLKITTAPAIYAASVGISACEQMFYGCTRLVNLTTLPATTLSDRCYDKMFMGCTSLTTIPAGMLPATNLAFGCYSKMFSDCSVLTTAPLNLLPATTLAKACYNNMFFNCFKLSQAPELPATDAQPGCYFAMFRHCKALTRVKCLINLSASNPNQRTDSRPNGYLDSATPDASDMESWTVINLWTVFNKWLGDVGSNGTFIKNPSMSFNKGDNSIGRVPSSWTITNNS